MPAAELVTDMPNRLQLDQQLRELDFVLEALEGMNLRQETTVPGRVTRLLHELGLVDRAGLSGPELQVRVLDKQQHVRRRLSLIRRHGI
jgi:hypothetical protein